MRSWSVYIGRFVGVEFRVHFAFFFLLLFILLIPSSHSWEPDTMVRGVELTALILISVFLRELGRALAALRHERPLRGILLLPIGGIAAADPNPPLRAEAGSLGREIRISLAGPMVSLLFAAGTGTVLLLQAPAASLWSVPLVTTDW